MRVFKHGLPLGADVIRMTGAQPQGHPGMYHTEQQGPNSQRPEVVPPAPGACWGRFWIVFWLHINTPDKFRANGPKLWVVCQTEALWLYARFPDFKRRWIWGHIVVGCIPPPFYTNNLLNQRPGQCDGQDPIPQRIEMNWMKSIIFLDLASQSKWMTTLPTIKGEGEWGGGAVYVGQIRRWSSTQWVPEQVISMLRPTAPSGTLLAAPGDDGPQTVPAANPHLYFVKIMGWLVAWWWVGGGGGKVVGGLMSWGGECMGESRDFGSVLVEKCLPEWIMRDKNGHEKLTTHRWYQIKKNTHHDRNSCDFDDLTREFWSNMILTHLSGLLTRSTSFSGRIPFGLPRCLLPKISKM